MMKKFFSCLILVCCVIIVTAQSASEKSIPQNIKNLCGCFEVEFKYAETFSPDKNYKFHEREEISGGTELVLPVEVSDKKIVMQHLLVITDSMIIKHWREEWTFENPVLFRYQGNMKWVKEQLTPAQVKNKWTQTVWEVSDAPRYQGISEWLATDGKTFWQNTTDAPLPRREYTQRSDYNILKRTNRLIINNDGWVHEQDNQKVLRNGNTDKLIAEEKGINSYKRLDDKHCEAAKAYWKKNENYWSKVRAAWDDYMNTHTSVELKATLDGKPLYEYLNQLAADFAAGKIKPAEIDAKIKASLDKFINADKSVAGIKN